MMVTRADKWLIGVLLLLAAVGIGFSTSIFQAAGESMAQITVDGKLLKSIPLRQSYREEFRIGDGAHYNVVEVEDKRIRIRDADCPDQICVRTGWVSVAPQQIVCLPYKVVIKIVSSGPSDIDDIAR
ncbi:MAG TPA: NusG domain II-containing protein [Negativicutes bacterium]